MRSTFTRTKKVSPQDLGSMLVLPLVSQDLSPSSLPSEYIDVHFAHTALAIAAVCYVSFCPPSLLLISTKPVRRSIRIRITHSLPHVSCYATGPLPSVSSISLFAAHPASCVQVEVEVLLIRHSSYIFCMGEGILFVISSLLLRGYELKSRTLCEHPTRRTPLDVSCAPFVT
jgi:hypothetical protein